MMSAVQEPSDNEEEESRCNGALEYLLEWCMAAFFSFIIVYYIFTKQARWNIWNFLLLLSSCLGIWFTMFGHLKCYKKGPKRFNECFQSIVNLICFCKWDENIAVYEPIILLLFNVLFFAYSFRPAKVANLSTLQYVMICLQIGWLYQSLTCSDPKWQPIEIELKITEGIWRNIISVCYIVISSFINMDIEVINMFEYNRNSTLNVTWGSNSTLNATREGNFTLSSIRESNLSLNAGKIQLNEAENPQFICVFKSLRNFTVFDEINTNIYIYYILLIFICSSFSQGMYRYFSKFQNFKGLEKYIFKFVCALFLGFFIHFLLLLRNNIMLHFTHPRSVPVLTEKITTWKDALWKYISLPGQLQSVKNVLNICVFPFVTLHGTDVWGYVKFHGLGIVTASVLSFFVEFELRRWHNDRSMIKNTDSTDSNELKLPERCTKLWFYCVLSLPLLSFFVISRFPVYYYYDILHAKNSNIESWVEENDLEIDEYLLFDKTSKFGEIGQLLFFCVTIAAANLVIFIPLMIFYYCWHNVKTFSVSIFHFFEFFACESLLSQFLTCSYEEADSTFGSWIGLQMMFGCGSIAYFVMILILSWVIPLWICFCFYLYALYVILALLWGKNWSRSAIGNCFSRMTLKSFDGSKLIFQIIYHTQNFGFSERISKRFWRKVGNDIFPIN